MIFAPGLERTERARRSLNLFYETAEHLKPGEFTKFVRRWRQLTAPLAEPLTELFPKAIAPLKSEE